MYKKELPIKECNNLLSSQKVTLLPPNLLPHHSKGNDLRTYFKGTKQDASRNFSNIFPVL